MTNKKTDDLFNDENEAGASAWFKREKIGDSCQGTLVGSFTKPAVGKFKEQLVYELQQEDGSVINLPVFSQYMEKALRRARIGQIVGARYVGDFLSEEMKKQGNAAAKTVKVYLGAMDPNHIASMGKEVTEEEANSDLSNVEFN